MSKVKELLIATTNSGKVAEFKELFKGTGIEVKSLLDFPNPIDVEETEDTLEGNAILKAETIMKLYGIPTISDDSGFFVNDLGGFPGVHSARFTGVHRNYAVQNGQILELMREKSDRSAYYKTVIAYAEPDGTTQTFTGLMELEVADNESSVSGFSYDTIVKYGGRYVSELPIIEKNKVSSRAGAVSSLLDYLKFRW